jgi:hypothetical protein
MNDIERENDPPKRRGQTPQKLTPPQGEHHKSSARAAKIRFSILEDKLQWVHAVTRFR